jgi:CBS domain containing-hemolysin-like protein
LQWPGLAILPRAGERISHHDVIFEVIDLDGRRIDKVLVYREAARTRRPVL